MLHYLTAMDYNALIFLGMLFAFVASTFCISKLSKFLPKDMGRQFAVEGAKSAGKPRGAGLIFVFVFVAATLLFVRMNAEIAIYLLLIVIEMFTGYFDDAADKPWNEYLKGALDLVVAIVVAVTYLYFNGSDVTFAIIGQTVHFHPVVFGLLTVALIWAAINVTNCTDGVDGLSGTLTVISSCSVFVIYKILGNNDPFSYTIPMFVAVMLGYLWFNATPSKLLMGDAGSRAEGMFVALVALKTGCPFLYLLVAAVFIVDGGLGLVKVALLRFLKIRILKNTLTPIHDHVRKNGDWSNTQVVFRFAIIQIVISACAIGLIGVR